jgi:hypothetical protein
VWTAGGTVSQPIEGDEGRVHCLTSVRPSLTLTNNEISAGGEWGGNQELSGRTSTSTEHCLSKNSQAVPQFSPISDVREDAPKQPVNFILTVMDADDA